MFGLQPAGDESDASRCDTEPRWVWAHIAVIPIVGILAYFILHLSSCLVDRMREDLNIVLREHQLSL